VTIDTVNVGGLIANHSKSAGVDILVIDCGHEHSRYQHTIYIPETVQNVDIAALLNHLKSDNRVASAHIYDAEGGKRISIVLFNPHTTASFSTESLLEMLNQEDKYIIPFTCG